MNPQSFESFSTTPRQEKLQSKSWRIFFGFKEDGRCDNLILSLQRKFDAKEKIASSKADNVQFFKKIEVMYDCLNVSMHAYEIKKNN